MLAWSVGIVYLQHFVAQVGVADGIKGPGIEGAPFPFQMVLPLDVPLKPDEVYGLSGSRIGEWIRHVVSPQGIGNLDPEFLEAHEIDFNEELAGKHPDAEK